MTSKLFNEQADDILIFLMQSIVILITTRLLGVTFRKYLKEPMVIAEIIGGIILGQSALGQIHGYMSYLFSPTQESLPILSLVANIGLLFFMFIIGLEINPEHFRGNVRNFALIGIFSIGVPLALGCALSILLYQITPNVPKIPFVLFIGMSMAMTAFPVLCRILAEAQLLQSKVGVAALSAAAFDDVLGWIILAVTVSISRAESPLSGLWTFLLALGYVLFVGIGLRWVFNRVARRIITEEDITPTILLSLIVCIFTASWITDVIGIHVLFGAFTIGVIVPKKPALIRGLTEKLEGLVVLFMLPLYFTYSGLRVDLSLLNDGIVWAYAVLIIVIACLSKIFSAGITALLCGFSKRESLAIGILMNTRGLVELIVLNIGLDLKILTPQLFTMMVIMAIVTTMMTAPLLRLVYNAEFVREHEQHEVVSLTQESQYGLMHIILCISNRITAHNMVELVKPIATDHSDITALQVVPLSNMPSSYMIAQTEMAEMSPALMAAEQRGRDLNLVIRPLIVHSLDIAADIVRTCEQERSDLVVLTWNEPVFSSVSIESGDVIRSVIRSVTANVAVFIDRQNFASVLHRIFIPFCENEDSIINSHAMYVARLYARNPAIEVFLVRLKLTNDQEQILSRRSRSLAQPNAPHTCAAASQASKDESEFLSNKANERILRHLKKEVEMCSSYVAGIRQFAATGFQLVIVTADAFDRASVLDPLVENCPASLLIVYEKGEVMHHPADHTTVNFFFSNHHEQHAVTRCPSRVLPPSPPIEEKIISLEKDVHEEEEVHPYDETSDNI